VPDNDLSDLTAWLWATPNSRRVIILLEELALDYTIRPVNVRAGEQFAPEVVNMNPFAKIPIVSWFANGRRRTLFESGAILIHFANRFGRFLPADGQQRDDALSWTMMAISGLAPSSGQAHYWHQLAPQQSGIALEHAVRQVRRAWHALDDRLRDHEYLAGGYSIADIATWPWIERHSWTSLQIDGYPHLKRWFKCIGKRQAVQRALKLPRGCDLD